MEANGIGGRTPLVADTVYGEGGQAGGEMLSRQVMRMWAIAATAKIVSESGVESVQLSGAARRAGLGEQALANMFAGREELLSATFATACDLAAERAIPSYVAESGPVQRIRAGVAQLLAFRDAEPELSSVCLSHGAELASQQARVVTLLSRVLADELDACCPRPALAGDLEAAVAGAFAIVREAQPRPAAQAPDRLLIAVMEEILTPHLGSAAAQIEAALPVSETVVALSPRLYPDRRAGLDVRLTALLLSRLRERRGGRS